MGNRALDIDTTAAVSGLRTYAHCSADGTGTTYVVINTSTSDERTVATPSGSATLYQLTGESLDASTALLNGTALAVADDGTLPEMDGEAVDGAIAVAPASVSFVVDDTTNEACA